MSKLKDTKKIIIITFVVAIILSFITGFVTYKITLNNNSKEKNKNYLVVGGYSLQFGTYKGYNIEYEWDDRNEKMVEGNKKEFILKLNSDNTYELNGEKYKFSIDGSYIKTLEFNNGIGFKAIENNKIEYQVGSGIVMTYSNK